MKRLNRFIKLFFHYIGHVWYASKFEHSIYVLHGTNNVYKHRTAKAQVTKLVKK